MCDISTEFFDRYRLTRRIGGGQLNQVFAAFQRAGGDNEPVALKRAHPSLTKSPLVELVAREGALLSRLEHPGLCRCLHRGRSAGMAFFSLDLVHGCTLRALMRALARRNEPLPESASLTIALQMAQVLHYLHAGVPTPLAHLDVTPQNILVGVDGQVRLVDFGIARSIHEPVAAPLRGKIAGTVGYMAPEQARGEDQVTHRADQYSLGIVLWELLAGQRFYRGGKSQLWNQMQRAAHPEIYDVPGVQPKLLEIIEGLVQPTPEDRYSDLAPVIAGLEQLTSNPNSGRRPLGALVSYLIQVPGFDPFDRPKSGPAG